MFTPYICSAHDGFREVYPQGLHVTSVPTVKNEIWNEYRSGGAHGGAAIRQKYIGKVWGIMVIYGRIYRGLSPPSFA